MLPPSTSQQELATPGGQAALVSVQRSASASIGQALSINPLDNRRGRGGGRCQQRCRRAGCGRQQLAGGGSRARRRLGRWVRGEQRGVCRGEQAVQPSVQAPGRHGGAAPEACTRDCSGVQEARTCAVVVHKGPHQLSHLESCRRVHLQQGSSPGRKRQQQAGQGRPRPAAAEPEQARASPAARARPAPPLH